MTRRGPPPTPRKGTPPLAELQFVDALLDGLGVECLTKDSRPRETERGRRKRKRGERAKEEK